LEIINRQRDRADLFSRNDSIIVWREVRKRRKLVSSQDFEGEGFTGICLLPLSGIQRGHPQETEPGNIGLYISGIG